MKPPHPPSGGGATPPVRDAPAFDFFPERWLVGVAAMSDAEQLSYLRLLCHQWLLGDTGLPADLPALKRLAGKGVTETVLAKLPQGEDGKRRNQRLEVIRAEQRERIARAAEKGRKMAAGRWADKSSTSHAQASAMHAASTAQASAMQTASRAQALHDECPPPTTHRSPPTPAPEDANNASTGAGARKAAEPAAAPAAEDHAAALAAAEVKAAKNSAASKTACTETPSLPMVQAWAKVIGCPPDKAEIWWHEHEARPLSLLGRWTDRDGNAVMRPQHALAAWWQKWRANDHQRATRLHGPSSAHAHAAPVRSDPANAPGRYG
ncbi:hypothetical protein [Prosthecobacter sp.]|uniref:hypothetical protein n=1 Tax=Prosthecobacter sp. TaxID=1965333 RepID=UPI0037831F80